MHREMPIVEGRDWHDRAFTIGIGGYGMLYYTLFIFSAVVVDVNSVSCYQFESKSMYETEEEPLSCKG